MPEQLAVTAEPLGTAGVDRRPRRALFLAGLIITVVFVNSCLFGLLAVLLQPGVDFWHGLLAVLYVGPVLAIQLLYFSRPAVRLDTRLAKAMLAVQACLAYLSTLHFDAALSSLTTLAAGSALLLFRPRTGWTVFTVFMAGTIWILWTYDETWLGALFDSVTAVFYALVVYLLTWLARLVTELHQARTELARRAVAEQRLAFARDLHDLLGLSLSAIALKGELVHRLLRKSLDQARAELAEITGIAQRTLSDVRSVARGYRELSLDKESRTAVSLLSASNVAVRVELEQVELPVKLRTLLAKVLREGVTNVLRYTGVEHCEITVRETGGRVVLEIAHDGTAHEDVPEETAESLREVTEEVAGHGGKLSAGTDPAGRWRLHAELPVPEQAEPAEAALEQEPGHWSRIDARNVQWTMSAVFIIFSLSAMARAFMLTDDGWSLTLIAGYLTALTTLQLSYFARPNVRLRSRQSYALLFVQACLIFLPLIPLGHAWVSLPSLFAGTALLVLPPLAGWTAFAATAVGVVLIRIGYGTDFLGGFYSFASILNTGLMVFGLIWLIRLVTELGETRKRLAEVAVAEERLRFARDLHDLLGMSLSAIALKSELTSRIMDIDTTRASDELLEILGLTRQALADVRSVASGYRELSLDQESRSAQAVLVAADVQVRLEIEQDDLPTTVRTVLAVVLREGVTNVLRHSKVERCEIAVRRTVNGVALDIVNDGVQNGRPPDPERPERVEAPGSGITNMSDRVTGLGGELTAGVEADGRFRLHAVVPV
ncbi:histidine kinase [Amycolatopsis sp. WAC 01375]|uniref:sensor histidine kinase n=1 Tax=unclassified Amycolatopsis TaxID=2618356 RepID=UPI000F784CDF|nr:MULTISPECIES: histidine kinase [unclassified Amycolatopsis]RSM77593.1 histidine kinase [Amycolatopsis sp. WAC 01375]RSN22232.1 histidine kinase [Amycolatopsis sp. WAC 01416]